MTKKIKIIKSFDYIPKPSVVMAFKAGEVRDNMTSAQIRHGKSLDAIIEIKNSDSSDANGQSPELTEKNNG